MGWSEIQWRCDKCGNIQTREYTWNGKCDGCNRTVGEKTKPDVDWIEEKRKDENKAKK
jgi:predicted ATP-dependent serine protease